MSRLYWRIFLSFWLVLLLTLIVTASFNALTARDDLEAARLQALSASLDALGEQAQRSLDAGGEAGLLVWLEANEAMLNVPLFIITPDGKELRGRKVPRFLQNQSGTSTQRRPGFLPRFKLLPLLGPRGEYQLYAVRLHKAGQRWMFAPDARRMFPLILFIVSGIACFLMARYLTRPIRAFRTAGQRIAEGDLSARVGAPVANRKDEFGALAKDFDNMAAQVEGLLESKQRLLRDVSHELRSPLTRLQAAAGLLRQQSNDAPDPNLDRIEHEAETLNDMIGQILTFARLESMQQVDREPVDLIELVAEVVDNANFAASVSGRRVDLVAPATLSAEFDPLLLQRAVDNLVRNAVEHSVQLTTVTITAANGAIRITVADDGPGVPAADLDHIFETFFTSSPSNSAAGKGTGIGLAIARRAVQLHGGTIAARNLAAGGLLVEILF